MADKIICLVGESGSGKSTIAEMLEKEGYNYIQSYTTRKPRYKGEKGHIFVESEPLWLKERGSSYYDIIAYTRFDNNFYWATKEQYQGKGTSIYIIDPAGIKRLKREAKDAEIIVIYLKADERDRFYRMLTRAQKSKDSPYDTELENINKRMQHDREVFKIVECDYTVDANRSVEEVFKDVKSIIR